MAKAEVIELLHLGESPTPKVEAITENVSPSGVRVITNSMCAPGELLRLGAPKDHLSLSARVVYCQRVEESKFAVGLELAVRVEEWQKPPRP
jgi:PilZ domain